MPRPKHSKGRPDGQRSAGHPRWARAAGNAALRPNSKSARLYLTRVTAAFTIAEAVRNGEDEFGLSDRQPYVFRELRYDGKYDRESGKYVSRQVIRQAAVTCGVHCMVMQSQIRFHISRLAAELDATLKHPQTGEPVKQIEAVNPRSLRVGTRCSVCDSVIRSR